MTGLAPHKAAQFVRDDSFESSQAVTEACGIRALLPAAKIDDYVFEPCGYSMNGMDGLQVTFMHGGCQLFIVASDACQNHAPFSLVDLATGHCRWQLCVNLL